MKRTKRSLFICIAACSLLLGGCGNGLHELTAEEEDLIVHYAAYVVAKHNIQQKDGMSGVYIAEEELESSENDGNPAGTEDEDTQNPGDGSDVSNEGQDTGDTAITLADAIGHGSDLSITYGGSYTADNYIEGSAYSIDASAGKTFYIMKFTLINTTQADVTVDNATKSPVFKVTSGDISASSAVTFLMTDLSTYIGTIPAGQSVETILLFEIPENSAEVIAEPALQIMIDGQTKNIKL